MRGPDDARVAAAPPPADPPERFGKYIVLGRIARGGMAEIYRVKTVGLAGFEKVQALKRILPQHARDPRFVRSFIDEARVAVSLSHRNIVQVFEFGKVGDDLLLAMELIEGVSLREALEAAAAQRHPLPLPLACYILAEVAAGLDYAHRRTDAQGRPLGIVHCDVSPPNIALSSEGYVKILDFGVARASFTTKVSGRLRGKPRYMAPEQTRGETPTFKTDVFALGVVAWEMLAGRPLFDGPDVESILAAIRRGVVPPLADVLPEAPRHLGLAIAAALSADPGARGSAIDLHAAFARALRLTDPGTGSRALARWLGELFPPPVEALPTPAPTRPMRASQPPPSFAAPEELPTPPVGSLPKGLAPVHATADDTSTPVTGTLGEKRHVVVAAGLLAGGADEDRRALRRMLADLAYKQGATVHADEPGEVLALFGLEVAGEDDVAHAARFALAAHEAARESQAPEQPVSLSIGVHQGLLTRRRTGVPAVGRDAWLLYTELCDEARAVARTAPAGGTLVTGDPGRLAARHFEFVADRGVRRGGRRLKSWALLGARQAPPAEPPSAPAAPFVGREAELSELSLLWARALGEDRRVTAAIVGEAGLGKSRLVAEFAAHVADARPLVLACVAGPGGRETPYALALQIFAAGLRVSPERGAEGRARLLEAMAASLRARGVDPVESDEVLATLEHALELRDGAAPAGDEHASANLRDRMVASVATLRELHRSSRPRLTLVEDWHWADGASAETLKLVLGGRPPAGAELVLVTARPPDARDGGETQLPPGCEAVLTLSELGGDARSALIRACLGDGARPAHAQLVERRAGGNPLYIEELARALAELGPRELPETLRGVITARVDRLPQAAKAALQHAAVLGPVFRSRLLEELLGRGLRRSLRALEEAGILVGAGARPGARDEAEAEAGDLAFRHGLWQEVVYEALTGGARRDAHRRVGELLAARHEAGRAESPLAIARHLELGGDPTRAADFYLRAGRLALAAHDAEEARETFTRALELGTRRRGEAISGRADASFNLGDHEAQKRDLDELLILWADEPRKLADALSRTAARHLRLGEYAAAVAATEAAERAAERAGDERGRGEALRLRGEAFERQADFERAHDAVSRALEIFRRIGAVSEQTRALIGVGRILLMGSRFDEALAYYRPALERVRESGDQWLERIVCNNISVIHVNRKEFPEALENTRRSLEICRRFGDRAREGDNCSVMSTILLELGLYDEAREWAERGLAIHAETGSRWSRADALVYAAHRETLAGDPALGLSWLEEAIALAREIGARYVLANAKNQLAMALIRRGEPGDLLRAEREALEAAELGREANLPAVEIQGRSRSALARLEMGDAQAARTASLAAVQALDRVRCIEWSEEEILHTHYRVLRALGDPMAQGFLARAYAGVMAKLERLDEPHWREAWLAIELHRRIAADRESSPRGHK